MLCVLTLRQLAIVEFMEIEWSKGFTVITGESGAGKSLLILGLNLALGSRAETAQIRAGAERAEVSAVFDTTFLPEAQAWMKERAYEEGTEVVLRRVISRDGRSRAFINGTQVSTGELRQLAGCLLEIYGQHEHQSLLRKEAHRRVLERFAGLEELAATVSQSWRDWQALLVRQLRTQEDRRLRQERLQLLSQQAQELVELNLGPDELRAIEIEYDLLAHVDARREHMLAAVELVDQEEGGLRRQLHQLVQHLQALADAGEGWRLLAESARENIKELEHELRYALEHLEADPQRLAWLDERLASIHRMARKYHCEARELPELLLNVQGECLSLQEAMDEQGLQAQADALQAQFREAALHLSERRQEAAGDFAAKVMLHFPSLGMQHAQLQFRLQPLDTPDARGLEEIEIYFNANPGQEARSLIRVASGGELSRISLALQVVYAQATGVPTLVFDEVDVGVSGSVAEAVGRLLRQLGQRAQILCITHQPQVAALGHEHWRVEKQVVDTQVSSRLQRLDNEQRIDELARLSGGMEITQATVEHARALFEATL